MKIVSLDLDYALNYCKIDIDKEDIAYKSEIKLINDCIEAATAYLINATDKEYPESDTNNEYVQEKLFLCSLIADMYERRSPTVAANTNEIYKSTIRQLQLK